MNFKTHVRALVVVCLAGIFLICAVGVRAQGTGDLVGTVTDGSGGILPGANVTLTNTGTGISLTSQTNGAGDYVFTLVQIGNYTVKVEAQGFKTYSAPNVTLSAGDRIRVDAKMEVGAVTQTVEVTATASALQTDNGHVSSLVTSQAVEDIPLNGRNVVKLVQLAPGVTQGLPNSKAAGTLDDRRLTSAFSANGQADFENNNLIDGMDNNERLLGSIGVRPSIDAIQEVNISTNLYDASVGRTAGGVADVVTKAGTNNFHGSAFEFFRNKVLNANPNYNFGSGAVPNPSFQQNQYGGSVGGPIRRNKTFFFADYEGFSQAQGLPQTIFTVPTYCEKGLVACPDGHTQFGDFSDLNMITPPGGSPTGAAGGAGPDIAAGSITALGRAYFNLYPLPQCGPGTATACGANSGVNGTLSNYGSAPTRFLNLKTWDGRIDHHFSDKDSLFVRYTLNDENTLIPDNFPVVYIDPATGNKVSSSSSGAVLVHPGAQPSGTAAAGTNTERQQGFAAAYTHIFRPTLLLTLKAGYLRSAIQSLPLNQGSNVSNALGFPCNATTCVNYNSLASGLAAVTVTQTNFGTAVPPRLGDSQFIPEFEFDNSFINSAGLNWTKGAHSFKFGLGIIRRDLMYFQNSVAAGAFTFTGAYTGIGYGDLLEGLALSQNRTNQLNNFDLRTWEPSGYMQDDWRARHWLTLNLGVRYDIFTPYTEAQGRFSNYDPYLGLLVSPSIPGIQQSSRTAFVPTIYTDFAPRLGFAATLSHQFVIRGGFGLSFYPDNYLSQAYLRNAPFTLPETCQVQNTGGSNNTCSGVFANSATTNFGSTNGSGSQVGKAGGASLAGGVPVPYFNISNATNPAAYAGLSIVGLPIHHKEAYLEQFNLQVQKAIAENVITVGYVGELGRHTNYSGGTGTISIPQNQPANPAETQPLTIGGMTSYYGAVPGFNYLKTTSLTEQSYDGISSYHGLQVSLVRRFSHGLTASVNYTWSHTMDNTEGGTTCVSSEFAAPTPCWVDISRGAAITALSAANPCSANPTTCGTVLGWQGYGRGNSNQNAPNRIAWAVNYDLPFGKSLRGVAGVVAKGWGVNTSGSWQSGLPFTVTESSSVAGISGVSAVRLDQVGSGKLSNQTIQQWFDPSSFVRQTNGTLGYQDNNQLTGPRQRHLDVSLFKDFQLTERIRMQFRTEVFNLFNTPNFANPNASITTFTSGTPAVATFASGVGNITALNSNENPRQIQFALKVLF